MVCTGRAVYSFKNQSPTRGWLHFAENVVEKVGVIDEEMQSTLIRAFASVPRDLFVEGAFNLRAKDDISLPIGFGQTISKPTMVARMLALAGVQKGMRVLEIGCGCGYASCIMAAAGATVFAVEKIGLLAQKTRRLLDKVGFQNIIIRIGDGRRGWAEHAPYDAIIISAAFENIEPEILAQLKNPGGRMVAPVGNQSAQILTLWEAKGEGVRQYQLEPCKFVEGT